MRELLKQTPTAFHRYLYKEIPWESRLVGILGAKGVGKSTLILQHIKEMGVPKRLPVHHYRKPVVCRPHTY